MNNYQNYQNDKYNRYKMQDKITIEVAESDNCEEQLVELIRKDPFNILFMKSPSKNLQRLATSVDPFVYREKTTVFSDVELGYEMVEHDRSNIMFCPTECLPKIMEKLLSEYQKTTTKDDATKLHRAFTAMIHRLTEMQRFITIVLQQTSKKTVVSRKIIRDLNPNGFSSNDTQLKHIIQNLRTIQDMTDNSKSIQRSLLQKIKGLFAKNSCK